MGKLWGSRRKSEFFKNSNGEWKEYEIRWLFSIFIVVFKTIQLNLFIFRVWMNATIMETLINLNSEKYFLTVLKI